MRFSKTVISCAVVTALAALAAVAVAAPQGPPCPPEPTPGAQLPTAPPGALQTLVIQNNFAVGTDYFGSQIDHCKIWIMVTGDQVVKYYEINNPTSPTVFPATQWVQLSSIKSHCLFLDQAASIGVYAALGDNPPPEGLPANKDNAEMTGQGPTKATCLSTGGIPYAYLEYTIAPAGGTGDLSYIDQFSYPSNLTSYSTTTTPTATAATGFKSTATAQSVLDALTAGYLNYKVGTTDYDRGQPNIPNATCHTDIVRGSLSDWCLGTDTLVSADKLTTGSQYQIINKGNTNWESCGALAMSLVQNKGNNPDFVPQRKYYIKNVGGLTLAQWSYLGANTTNMQQPTELEGAVFTCERSIPDGAGSQHAYQQATVVPFDFTCSLAGTGTGQALPSYGYRTPFAVSGYLPSAKVWCFGLTDSSGELVQAYAMVGPSKPSFNYTTTARDTGVVAYYGQSFNDYLEYLFQHQGDGYYIDSAQNNGFSFALKVLKQTADICGKDPTYSIVLTDFVLDRNGNPFLGIDNGPDPALRCGPSTNNFKLTSPFRAGEYVENSSPDATARYGTRYLGSLTVAFDGTELTFPSSVSSGATALAAWTSTQIASGDFSFNGTLSYTGCWKPSGSNYVPDSSQYPIFSTSTVASLDQQALLPPKSKVNETTASDLLENYNYYISVVGNIDWTQYGAQAKLVGSLVAGEEYYVNNLGTTSQEDWERVGCPSCAVGKIFAATSATDISGTGTAVPLAFKYARPSSGQPPASATGTAYEYYPGGGIASYTIIPDVNGDGGCYPSVLKAMMGKVSALLTWGMINQNWDHMLNSGIGVQYLSQTLGQNRMINGQTIKNQCGEEVLDWNTYVGIGPNNVVSDPWTRVMLDYTLTGPNSSGGLFTTPYLNSYGDFFGGTAFGQTSEQLQSPDIPLTNGGRMVWELGVVGGTPNNCCSLSTDINGDGDTSGADLALFLGGFGTNQSNLDFDDSGTVDGGDLAVFLAAWEQGGSPTPCTPKVPSWATAITNCPDPNIVTSNTLRDNIVKGGWAWKVKDNITGIHMVWIPLDPTASPPSATFTMGCSPASTQTVGCLSIENPTHPVTLTSAVYNGEAGFYMSVGEVTQAEWMYPNQTSHPNPSYFLGSDLPVETVRYSVVNAWLKNASTGSSALTSMRLPTEAEWEYAYRAGTTTAFHGYPGATNGSNDPSTLMHIAWYAANSKGTTHSIYEGNLQPNGFGLYNMSGNVWEWVSDRRGHYENVPPGDNPQGVPINFSTCAFRTENPPCYVLRGGHWGDNAEQTATIFLRSSTRGGYPDVVIPEIEQGLFGFRVARNAESPSP